MQGRLHLKVVFQVLVAIENIKKNNNKQTENDKKIL